MLVGVLAHRKFLVNVCRLTECLVYSLPYYFTKKNDLFKVTQRLRLSQEPRSFDASWTLEGANPLSWPPRLPEPYLSPSLITDSYRQGRSPPPAQPSCHPWVPRTLTGGVSHSLWVSASLSSSSPCPWVSSCNKPKASGQSSWGTPC